MILYPTVFRFPLVAAALLFAVTLRAESSAEISFESDIRPLVQRFCVRCHGGDEVHGDVDFSVIQTQQDLIADGEIWESAVALIRDGIMPPADELLPSSDEKKLILDWYQGTFVDSVKAHPGYFRPRRLAAHEYRNTLHSVFGFPLEVAIIEAEQTVTEKSLVIKLLPMDPPGRSGFKNDTSGNPLTTVVWDQYSYLIDFAILKLFSPEQRPHLEIIVGDIDGSLTRSQCKRLIRTLSQRVYRRPIDEAVIARSLTALDEASVDQLDQTTRLELKTILMSPQFFYRGLMMQVAHDELVDVDSFELAERLSYFLWADMPDDELIQVAASGKLEDPDVYKQQIDRMLASPKARSLAEHLGVEWFSLDQIDDVSNNPPVADALKSQPIDYLNYLFTQDRPILELIDSRTAFINSHTAKFYPGDRKQLAAVTKPKGVEIARLPNQMITLDECEYRGGFLTIPGVLAMNRGPVLRGTWMLERVLGESLPDPPANVGQVPANRRGEQLSFRQRFEMHRSNPTCAVCHDKIDPLGFSLQHYDASGAHQLIEPANRKKQKGKLAVDVPTIDASGRLPSGETFGDFQELKQILVTQQRGAIVQNVVRRVLGYALCRKLEYHDRHAVEEIAANLGQTDGTFRDLIHQVCNSLPMRQTVVRGGDATDPSKGHKAQ